jgi:hypothetical protein
VQRADDLADDVPQRGGPGDRDGRVPSIPSVMNELSLLGCNCYDSGGREFAPAAAVLAADPEIAATVITHRFPAGRGRRGVPGGG